MSLISRIGSLIRKRSKQETPDDQFLSIVALLLKAQTLSEEDLSKRVERAYGLADEARDADRILQAINPGYAYFLKVGPHLLNVINSFNPYVDDPTGASTTIPELRRRKVFAEHRAWRSIDYLRGPFKAEAAKAYAVLAKLSAELLTNDCLGLYFPQSNEIVPFRPGLEDKLRGFVSLDALQETFDIIVPVEEDDPGLAEIVAEARARWPEFLRAFSRRQPDDAFLVKSRFADENGQEWMWSTVERIEAGRLIGRLSNRPNSVTHVSEGDKVVVQAAEIGDWFYGNDTEQVGQFSMKLIRP